MRLDQHDFLATGNLVLRAQVQLCPNEIDDFAQILSRCSNLLQPDEDTLALRTLVNSRQAIEVFDYEKSAATFTRAYCIRNALKCFGSLLASSIKAGRYSQVYDLGCGSGAFSLAFAHLANNPGLVIHGIDASSAQLAIAKELLAVARCPGNISFELGTIPRKLDVKPDLTLSSFWFCENRDAYRDPARFDLMLGEELFVVDYEEVTREIGETLPAGFRVVCRNSIQLAVPEILQSNVGQGTATAHSLHIARG